MADVAISKSGFSGLTEILHVTKKKAEMSNNPHPPFPLQHSTETEFRVQIHFLASRHRCCYSLDLFSHRSLKLSRSCFRAVPAAAPFHTHYPKHGINNY
ncbi:hypothetical protein L1987_15693 [Smallanthus sonchifolius]|uniref:Uncharacterized protein n=1 Tax=Smallanthus sonchifolius TaxID=185202 RepID=A0ACB9J6A6_9ASTR|nr:hypothetical protein L1987_15693 [Smallanthus sonchifolius]